MNIFRMRYETFLKETNLNMYIKVKRYLYVYRKLRKNYQNI